MGSSQCHWLTQQCWERRCCLFQAMLLNLQWRKRLHVIIPLWYLALDASNYWKRFLVRAPENFLGRKYFLVGKIFQILLLGSNINISSDVDSEIYWSTRHHKGNMPVCFRRISMYVAKHLRNLGLNKPESPPRGVIILDIPTVTVKSCLRVWSDHLHLVNISLTLLFIFAFRFHWF